jgi:hypothetical protein
MDQFIGGAYENVKLMWGAALDRKGPIIGDTRMDSSRYAPLWGTALDKEGPTIGDTRMGSSRYAPLWGDALDKERASHRGHSNGLLVPWSAADLHNSVGL